jgi:hypothetical protein
MGRIVTPKYVVEVEVSGPYRHTRAPWRREYGRPNAIDLGKYVAKFEASTRPGGANEHIGPTTVLRARIKLNVAGGATVATFEGTI